MSCPLVRPRVQATSPAPSVCLVRKIRTWWHMWRRLSYGACHHLVSHRPSVWSSPAKTTLTQTQNKKHTYTHTYTNTHDTLTYIHNHEWTLPPNLLSLTCKFHLLFSLAWSSASFCGRMVSKLVQNIGLIWVLLVFNFPSMRSWVFWSCYKRIYV